MNTLILPVKMLKGVTFNDQVALDIVLEDAVKDTWQGEATLSGGASLQGRNRHVVRQPAVGNAIFEEEIKENTK